MPCFISVACQSLGIYLSGAFKGLGINLNPLLYLTQENVSPCHVLLAVADQNHLIISTFMSQLLCTLILLQKACGSLLSSPQDAVSV